MRIEIRNYFNELLVGLDYPNLEELTSEQKTFIIGRGNYSDYNVEFTEDGIVILKQNSLDNRYRLPETLEVYYRVLVKRIVEYI
jgi:hypothetical protein